MTIQRKEKKAGKGRLWVGFEVGWKPFFCLFLFGRGGRGGGGRGGNGAFSLLIDR